MFLSSTPLKTSIPLYPEMPAEALDYTKKIVDIPHEHIEIILQIHFIPQWRCSLKKKSKDDFDVSQGSFNGANISELMGLFILNKIK